MRHQNCPDFEDEWFCTPVAVRCAMPACCFETGAVQQCRACVRVRRDSSRSKGTERRCFCTGGRGGAGAAFLPSEANRQKPHEKPTINRCGLLESVTVQMHPQHLE